MKAIIKFLKEEDGVTAIEYGLIAAGVAAAIATIVGIFKTDMVALFTDLGEQMNPPD